ncbi:hypothetical protein GALMADRAFT_211843 [Galerina marginata CBS 339.88]|uniref:Uncharacterized protein n=1 Tax=Galerina marginata (strain CBS 339.88) TaxID=685588 RepID=A0A067STH8_GALM3|nr:hypothetical protein GALMADRAFT_211843 [Galerina marginata CBS 339.88]
METVGRGPRGTYSNPVVILVIDYLFEVEHITLLFLRAEFPLVQEIAPIFEKWKTTLQRPPASNGQCALIRSLAGSNSVDGWRAKDRQELHRVVTGHSFYIWLISTPPSHIIGDASLSRKRVVNEDFKPPALTPIHRQSLRNLPQRKVFRERFSGDQSPTTVIKELNILRAHLSVSTFGLPMAPISEKVRLYLDEAEKIPHHSGNEGASNRQSLDLKNWQRESAYSLGTKRLLALTDEKSVLPRHLKIGFWTGRSIKCLGFGFQFFPSSVSTGIFDFTSIYLNAATKIFSTKNDNPFFVTQPSRTRSVVSDIGKYWFGWSVKSSTPRLVLQPMNVVLEVIAQ